MFESKHEHDHKEKEESLEVLIVVELHKILEVLENILRQIRMQSNPVVGGEIHQIK